MGLISIFRDTKIAGELHKAAAEINEYTYDMCKILDRYNDFANFSSYDKCQIRDYLRKISNKSDWMYKRMQDLAPDHVFITKVPCMDGSMTSVVGYVMAVKTQVEQFKNELNGYI